MWPRSRQRTEESHLQSDVQAYVKGVISGGAAPAAAPAAGMGGGLDLLPWPKIDFAKFGEIEVQPLSRIKKISGANLSRNWVMIPAVTYHEDADITELEAFRVQINKENEKGGDKSAAKLTMLAFLIKACGQGDAEIPRVQCLDRRRQPGAEEVLQHRLRRRHAQRTDGAGDQECREQGRLRSRPRIAANWRARRATAS